MNVELRLGEAATVTCLCRLQTTDLVIRVLFVNRNGSGHKTNTQASQSTFSCSPSKDPVDLSDMEALDC